MRRNLGARQRRHFELLLHSERAPSTREHERLPLPLVCPQFYDQVHTTGIDIPHATQAMAAVTLGKDISLRDYVQGAWRMRRLGLGQRVMLLMIPEISLSVCSVSNTGDVERDVLAWLASNTIHFEQLQQCKLLQQDMQSLWRERGMEHLLRPLQAQQGAAAIIPGSSAVFEEECGICMHKRELVPLRPCMHRVCPPCRARISTTVRPDEEPRCPFCRVHVVSEVEQLDRDLSKRQELAGLFLEPLLFDVPNHWPSRHTLLQQLQAEAQQRSSMIADAAAVRGLLLRAEEVGVAACARACAAAVREPLQRVEEARIHPTPSPSPFTLLPHPRQVDVAALDGEDELRLDAEVTAGCMSTGCSCSCISRAPARAGGAHPYMH